MLFQLSVKQRGCSPQTVSAGIKGKNNPTAGRRGQATLKGRPLGAGCWWYGLGKAPTDGCDGEKIAAAFGLDRQAPTADRDRCGLASEGGRDTDE